ncbi:hypothetical protein PCANB_001195 [Pneumocystis canis]|nr:hypothetical protein PCANB_001195 [Pneumocystis canis]
MTYHHVDYILVAEFDIDQGPTISQQYPHSIGSDTKLLAELMLPDQAHMRSKDWTIFFLHKDTSISEKNQDSPYDIYENNEGDEPKLMYVLNLVNTKYDQDAKRGALVKAMALYSKDLANRNCHEYETSIIYLGVHIPIKIPLDTLPEVVGDFSLINLFQAFPRLLTKSFPLHAHLTTIGSHTHPIIVLMNAMLTQKRIVFLGHGQSAGDVAKYVLAACAMASGLGILRGFLERTFPYTDLSKIDYLLTMYLIIILIYINIFLVMEWWDILCDIDSGKIKISSYISPANIPTHLGVFFCNYINEYQQNDMDTIFIDEMQHIISCKYGEYSVRSRWRNWVLRFTKMACTYETLVYGSSQLSNTNAKDFIIPGTGWDRISLNNIPIEKKFCLQHQLNRLKILRNISYEDAETIYITLNNNVHTADELNQLLCYLPQSQNGLAPIAIGLFHPNPKVQFAVAELLERLDSHIAGRHFVNDLNRFQKIAFSRILSKKSKLQKNK